MSARTITAFALSALALSACAKGADSISPAYASKAQYSGLTCPQIDEEAARVASSLTALSDDQDASATADVVITTASILIFPIGLIALAATDDHEEEIASLKGQADALRLSYQSRGCSA